uniref:BPTI/Kunitz inhibitor domain-containing protein n=1 Tax=Plectus sambesii TaxID=2011161 RepID=A0A914V4D2_9BILA
MIDGIDFALLCSDGVPLLGDNDKPKLCSPSPHSPEYACPSTFWCHVGSTNSTYYCCPRNKKVDNSCHLPPANGFGTGRMRRWWFDWRSEICRELTYTGFGGNENNHLTKEDCEKACANAKSTSKEPEVTVYIPPGVSLPGTVSQSFPTQQPWTAPPTVSIVTGESSMQTVNSTQLPTTDATPSGRNEREKAMDPCELSPDKGKMVATRNSRGLKWYFDVAASRCVQFNYLGGGGNENNFDSEHTCVETCGGGPVEASSCQASLQPGEGPFKINRWFFDTRSKLCEQFIYTGRNGNANRFPTRKICEQACGAVDPTSIDATKHHIGNAIKIDGKHSFNQLPTAPVPTLNTASTLTPEYSGPFGASQPSPSSPTFIRVPATADTSFTSNPPANSASTGTNMHLWTPSPMASLGTAASPLPVFIPTGGEQISTESIIRPASQPSSTFFVNTLATFEPTSHTFVTASPPLPSNTIDEESQVPSLQAQVPRPVAVAIPVPAPSMPPMSQLPVGLPVQPCRQTASSTQMCSGQDATCPTGTFCQVGANIQQSVCCPVLGGNPCAQPMLGGTGTATSNRFYYDANSNRCAPFIYHGFQGNQNNFLTYELCQQTCGAINPCEVGQPFQVNNVNSRCSPSQQSCPAQYYCHVGADTLNSVCCPMQQQQAQQPMPCALEPATGAGTASLQRWAYSPTRRLCQPFTYTGTAGNQNNFLTRQDCLQTCATVISPCGTGTPLANGNGFQKCVTFGSSTCPSTHFCHMGATPDTTICCPISGSNQCHLTLATGSGTAVLSRYYFDAASSTCKAFTYTGLGGNENNFLSIADCRRACPEYDNPCPGGTPPVNSADGSVGYCSATNPSCPATYWCHFGSSRQDTVCCPFAGDPCNMPCVPGTGFAQLPRYSYNPTSRSCEPFTYSGKGGNQNNFLSKSECESSCPVLDNPCVAGFPATTSAGAAVLCSIANPTVCPSSYWCHIGATVSTTLCCPGAGDACRMPLARGNGNSVLNRWYYNTDTQTCVSFTYSGRSGNQNNFVSLAECRQRCPEFQNPCSTGQPHIGLSGQITHCGATTPSICPTTYWCHVGGTLDTSVCCPGAGNPCELPMSGGNGNANLLRYFYDRVTQTCQQFQYSGFGGNENNFVTQRSCEARCPVFQNPCAAGNPARDTTQNLVMCSVANMASCPSGFYCHIGASEQTTLCCPGNANPCTEPRMPGTGDASLPRFVYNSLTQQCLPMIYTGIGGNQNNFLSRAECETRCPVLRNPCTGGEPAAGPNGQYVLCSSTTPNVCPAAYWCHIGADATSSICCPGAENPCLLPLATGTGATTLGRWYFDTNLRRCTRFTYTGLGGNQNNFLTMQECQLRCPEFQNPCSTGDPAQAPSGGILFCNANLQTCPASYWCHIGSNSDNTVCCPGAGDPCLAAMLPGTGTSKLARWYFNQNTRQCLQFTYTGVGGNQNNFLSEAMCIQRCPVFRNPCTNQQLALDSIVACSSQNPNVCPAGYWCHIGGDATTSVCCPGAADPCQLSCAQGIDSGLGPFTRYYFDPQQRICKPFQYTGLGGNENNFLTKEDCALKCPEFINPCYMGEPFRESLTSLVRFCNTNAPVDCPNNYWCHVGAQPQTTVCCPGGQDPCTTPLAIGSGPANLPRWYFNTQSRQCQQFTYTGIGGNQNNFLTREACQRVCPEFSNPCGGGAPLTSLTGAITYCTAQNVNICPNGYYCHIGSQQESTVCCPGATDPCRLPMEVGRGSQALTRYYYNSLTRQCAQFTYSGEGGNSNNFIALQQCRQACPEFSNPCIGQPYRPVGGEILYCSTSSPCPPNYFCHYGADTTATMCCPNAGETIFGAFVGKVCQY